ncbi:MAG: hypothetical protein Q7S05_02140 [bacterium]|nr:hypothetical protein [bacterium]
MTSKNIFIAVGVLVMLGVGFYFYTHTATTPSVSTDTVEMIPISYTPPTSDAAPAGSHTYTNAQFHFSLQYPQDFNVKDRAEAGGAHTTTFESADGHEFQIFIRPYAEAQITALQIKIDTHGSAKGTPQEVVIGSDIHALLFESADPVLGALREVWFIYPEPGRGVQSYLFEVTTYLELDTWLADILKTLQFTG